jgi:phosphatidylserine/phosphatidylglycerophosphate/cardiolipin synthase-like enzyme
MVSSPRSLWVSVAVVAAVAAGLSVDPIQAQDTLPPHLGGSVASLGLPDRYKRHLALTLSLDRLSGEYVGVQARAGVTRPLGSPVTHLLSAGAEVYGGVRDTRGSVGVRPMLVSAFAGVGGGLDLDLVERRSDPFVMVQSPLRRGGIAGHGSSLRLEWYPTRQHSAALTAVRPIGPHYGRTRPRFDHVRLRDARPRAIDFLPDQVMAETLAELAESGARINKLTLVPMGRAGYGSRAALRSGILPVQAWLAERTVDEEIRHYHRQLERAFSLAIATEPLAAGEVTPLGAEVAASARVHLLDGVLFPYNRLIGQSKITDTTREFALHARGAFARWLIRTSDVPPERIDAAIFVFQRLLDVAEAARSVNRAAWEDSRLVWLPLQLALRPEDYVRQESLDTLISKAVGRRIQHGNEIMYVYNDRFIEQLVHSIGEAEEYHVLWVHDFRGIAEGRQPDRLSILSVTQAYLSALTRRVEAYDSVGSLPVFMLFLDQHYYELNASRGLLELLQDPLHHRLRLPGLSQGVADTIAAWQTELRQAVESSRLLAAERAEYGDRWLRRLVKVHVSVTNPADPSFRSKHVLGFLGTPDDIARDHRKAVVYDVSETYPFRGWGMYAGMGVGESYASPAWEDRAIMIRGPTALTLRDAARELLEQQGITGGAVPHVLRPRPRLLDYDERVRLQIDSMDNWGGVATRSLELHNSTGFGAKEITVAQATLFNLTSPGGVFKIPDSLWLNELYASLLAGAALRGTRVMIVVPSGESAPAHEFGLPGIHLLASKVVALGQELEPHIERAGGMLRVGIYHAPAQVHDLTYRMAALQASLERYAFLRELYPALHQAAPELGRRFSARFDPQDLVHHGDAHPAEDAARPGAAVRLTSTAAVDSRPAIDAPVFAKLHFKGFLYISREAWARLIAEAPLTEALAVYLHERDRQIREGGAVPEVDMAEALLDIGARLINPILDSITPEERDRWAFFLQIGSPNMDYRSMLLDGEVAVLVSGWTSLYAAMDFLLLTGLLTWADDQAEIDALIPPPPATKRVLTRWIRLAL